MGPRGQQVYFPIPKFEVSKVNSHLIMVKFPKFEVSKVNSRLIMV